MDTIDRFLAEKKNGGGDILKALEMSRPIISNFVTKEFSRQSIHYKLLDHVKIKMKDYRDGVVMADLTCPEKAWVRYASARRFNETTALSDDTEASKKSFFMKRKTGESSKEVTSEKEIKRETILAQKKAFIIKQRLERLAIVEPQNKGLVDNKYRGR